MTELPPVDRSRIIDLGRVGMPRLLYSLLMQRFTGRIELGQPPPDEGHRVVTFRGGLPRSCQWHVHGTRLGDLLVAHGLLSEGVLQEALAEHPTEKRLGRHLLDSQLVMPEELKGMLRIQAERRLIQLCSADDGEALVVPSEGEDDEDYPDARTLWVLSRGVREHYSPQRIERELGEHLHRPLRAVPPFDRYQPQFSFPKEEAAAVKLLQRPEGASVEDLELHGGLDPVRARQLVYLLGICNMLGAPQGESTGDAPLAVVSAVIPAGALRDATEALAVARKVQQQLKANTPAKLVLQIPDGADLQTIESAAGKLLARLSPHDVQGPDARREVAQARTAVEELRSQLRARRLQQLEVLGPDAVKSGDWERAVQLYEDLVELRANDPSPRAVLAWIRFQCSQQTARDVERALDVLGRVLGQEPDLVQAHYYRGCLLVEQGDQAAAMQSFEKVVGLDPAHGDAHRRLNALRDESGVSFRKPNKPEADGGTGRDLKKAQTKASSPARPRRPKRGQPGSGHPLWSGPWPTIWIVSGTLLFFLLLAQILLRLDIAW